MLQVASKVRVMQDSEVPAQLGKDWIKKLLGLKLVEQDLGAI